MNLLTADKQAAIVADLEYRAKIKRFMHKRSWLQLALALGTNEHKVMRAYQGRAHSLTPDQTEWVKVMRAEWVKHRPEERLYSIDAIAARHGVTRHTVERYHDRILNKEPLPRVK